MTVDFYTKAILTVIAVCLVVLSADRLLKPQPSYAQQMLPQRVVLAGVEYQVVGQSQRVPFTAGSLPTSAAVPITTVKQY